MTIPFRADIVGSFLRPQVLKQARADLEDNKITQAQLTAVEDAEVKRLVNKEVELGLKAVTDGEFRQQTWYLDFLTSFKGVKWNKLRPEQYAPSLDGLSPYGEPKFKLFEVIGKIEYNPDNDVFARYLALKAVTPAGIVPKVCVPSPSMFFQIGYTLTPEVYEGRKDEFYQDIGKAYNLTVRRLYELGLRYFEIDDCNFGLIACTYNQDTPEQRKVTNQRLIDIPLVNNLALADLPNDLYLTMHICRGNFRSTAFGGGSYAPIAESVAKVNVHGYFLEYDDERSGDFVPLKHIADYNGGVIKAAQKRVVLGLITTKTPALESEDAIIKRIDEASKYFPKDQLSLSCQCGFASTEHGNLLTEDEQWAKIALIIRIAKKVWGSL